MNRRVTADQADQRMMEASWELDRARQSPSHDDSEAWPTWQAAATEAWLSRHPGDRWLLRPAAGHRPTIDEIARRGDRLARAKDGVESTWRLAPNSPARRRTEAQVGFFHEQLNGLYGPIFEAIDAVRANQSPNGVETLTRFLEADVYCFRSGYVTVDVLQALKRATLPDPVKARLQRVVLAAIDGFDRREFRAFCRLAVVVADDRMRQELGSRATSEQTRTARHARWVLDALQERPARSNDS